MRDPSEAELVRRLRQGDPEAFRAIVERYERPILGYLVGLVRDRAAAEDLFQETFLKVLKGMTSYREQGRFRSYLFTTARNLALDHLRGRREDPTDDAELDRIAGVAADDPHAAAEQDEAHQMLRRALARLPGEQREMILLRYFGGFTFAELARMTGMPLGTALGRCHHGLRALRRLLAET